MRHRHLLITTPIVMVAAILAGACSNNTTTTPTTTTTTPAPACAFALGSTSASANGGGDTITVNVGASATTCAWTAVANATFITVTAGASGTGSGTVTLRVAANSGGTTRTGTATIASQTFTVTQSGGLVAGFSMFDPSATAGATNECQIRSSTGAPTTCTLRSTSFTFDSTAIVSYNWSIQYTYGTVKTISQSGAASSVNITDTCGQMQATDDGAVNPLSVTLTVTDAKGNTGTATAGSGNQPPLQVRLFNCGF